MFKEAKTVCDHLIIGLQSDPQLALEGKEIHRLGFD